ncbi:immediate early protein ICP-46 [European chub iridovirus]|nr:immediate early protein ICP-46 [European chub iridovirus]
MENVQITDASDNLAVYNDGATVRAVYTKDGQIIHKGLPFVRIASKEDVDKCDRFYSAYEGTMLHAIYTGDLWLLGTNKKLSCMKSKWAAKNQTFGQSFQNALQRIYVDEDDITIDTFLENKLDRTKSYIFLVRAIEDERLVCQVDPHHPGAMLLATCLAPGIFDYMDHCTIPEFPRHEMYSREEIGDDVYGFISTKPYMSGIIGITDNNQVIRLSLPSYMEKLKVRGVVPCLELRALHLMSHPKELDMLIQMFPDRLVQYMDRVRFEVDCLCEAYAKCFVVLSNYKVIMSKYANLDKQFMYIVFKELRRHRFTAGDNVHESVRNVIRHRFMRLPGTHKRRLLMHI